jgi:hypothetical protein
VLSEEDLLWLHPKPAPIVIMQIAVTIISLRIANLSQKENRSANARCGGAPVPING